MAKKNVLFIGGSVNQTSMGHAVAKSLEEGDDCDCYFTPYYCDGPLKVMARAGWLDFTVVGGRFRAQTEAYLRENGLKANYGGQQRDYDLVVTCSDLLIQKNIRDKKIVLIQEGMTDPENFMFPLVKRFGLPRWLTGNTCANGLSDAYQVFCVASEGYRDLFIQKGVKPEKIVVTGIPNFDNVAQFLSNDFPFKNYVLVAPRTCARRSGSTTARNSSGGAWRSPTGDLLSSSCTQTRRKRRRRGKSRPSPLTRWCSPTETRAT